MSELTGKDGADTPVPPDIPYVDGRVASPDELRAEAARQADPLEQNVDEARAALAETADEFARRLDPRPQIIRLVHRARPALFLAAALLALVVLRKLRRSHPDEVR